MSGVKRRSGRIPKHIGKMTADTVQMCWVLAWRMMKDPTISDRQKWDMVAKSVCDKTIPQEMRIRRDEHKTIEYITNVPRAIDVTPIPMIEEAKEEEGT